MPANILNVVAEFDNQRIALHGDMGVAFDAVVTDTFSIRFFTITNETFPFTTSHAFMGTDGQLTNSFTFGGGPGKFIDLQFDPQTNTWYTTANNLAAVNSGGGSNAKLVSRLPWEDDELPEPPDPTPTITLASNTATVSANGSVTLTATVVDTHAVTKVEFYRDNVLYSTDTTAPYRATDTFTYLHNGTHVYRAKLYDAAANEIESGTVSVTVNIPVPPPPDTTAPTVTVNASSANVTNASTLTITATATDNVAVTKVELLRDGVVFSTKNAAPWQATQSITIADNGTIAYTARAYDAAGNQATSEPVQVTVAIEPPEEIQGMTMDTAMVSAATTAMDNAETGDAKKGKRLAVGQSIIDNMKPAHFLNIYRDGVLVITADFESTLSIVDDGDDYGGDDSQVGDIAISLGDVKNGKAVISADINTGAWTFVLSGGVGGQYAISGTVGPEGSNADIVLTDSPIKDQIFDTVITLVVDRSLDSLTA